MDVAGSDAGAVDQARLAIDPDVQFHAEVPLLALLALMHLRITTVLPVFGRGRGRDQRGAGARAVRAETVCGGVQTVALG